MKPYAFTHIGCPLGAPRRAAGVRTLALVALAMLAWTSEAHAQQISFVGLTGGATLGDLYGGGVNTDARWGGTVGVTAGVRNWNYSVAQVEVSWIQKGGEDTRLDYVEIPFLFGALAETASGNSARAYTGIGVAFPVGCSADGNLCDTDRNTEWAWPIGLQLGRVVEGGRFVALDVRYSIGLSDAFKAANVTNRSWQFRLVVGRSQS